VVRQTSLPPHLSAENFGCSIVPAEGLVNDQQPLDWLWTRVWSIRISAVHASLLAYQQGNMETRHATDQNTGSGRPRAFS
jgi:hypothetical protein